MSQPSLQKQFKEAYKVMKMPAVAERNSTNTPLFVRSELNLHKLIGLFASSQFKGRSRKLVRDKKNGKVEITIGIQYDNQGREVGIGVLRVPEYKTLEALIHLWELCGKPDRDTWIESSRYELASILGREWGGKDSKLLKKYLRNLAEIPIRWKRFYSRERGLIDILEPEPLRFLKLAFLTTKRGKKEIDWRFKFRFDERFHSNLCLGYTKPFLLNVIAPLSDVETLFYVHLDLLMAKRTHYVRKSKGLFADLGLMDAERNKWPSRRREIVQQVIQRFITKPKKQGRAGTPLTTGTLTNIKILRCKDGQDFKILFEKKPHEKLPSTRNRAETIALVREIEQLLEVGDHNRGFYLKVASRAPRDLIRTALRDTLDEERAGKLTGSKAQFFGWWIQVLAFERGLDLGLHSSFDYLTAEQTATTMS